MGEDQPRSVSRRPQSPRLPDRRFCSLLHGATTLHYKHQDLLDAVKRLQKRTRLSTPQHRTDELPGLIDMADRRSGRLAGTRDGLLHLRQRGDGLLRSGSLPRHTRGSASRLTHRPSSPTQPRLDSGNRGANPRHPRRDRRKPGRDSSGSDLLDLMISRCGEAPRPIQTRNHSPQLAVDLLNARHVNHPATERTDSGPSNLPGRKDFEQVPITCPPCVCGLVEHAGKVVPLAPGSRTDRAEQGCRPPGDGDRHAFTRLRPTNQVAGVLLHLPQANLMHMPTV